MLGFYKNGITIDQIYFQRGKSYVLCVVSLDLFFLQLQIRIE
jgi:hypothetical protein